MKRWSISIAILLAIAGVFSIFYFDRMTVSAQDIVMTGKPFIVKLSSPISKDAWANGEMYVEDQHGKKVKAQHRISESGKLVEISGLKEGAYTLYVKNKLVKSKHAFKVFKKLKSVQSEKELIAYFEKVKKAQGERTEGTVILEDTMEMSTKDSSGAGANHSTTNNQVEGVDEADTVKTNGSHIFTISENNVVIMNVKSPSQMKKEATIRLGSEFYPTQLLLADKTLMIIGQKNIYHTLEMGSTNENARMGFPMEAMTTVYFYDISNPSSPKLAREIGTEGYINGARLTDNTLYFVTTVAPKFWMLEEDKEMELRPFLFDSKKDKEAKPMNYTSISILPGSYEGNYSIISAISVENYEENEVMTKGYLGGSDQLYMSKDNLYLTSTIFEEANSSNKKMIWWNPGKMDTEVFKFALNETEVQFVGSNRLTGTILNQFSMDEHNGYFRAVTTKGNNWGEDEPSENNLFILDEGMDTVGSLTGLAKEERIYSARFMGDKAYMVTFKQTDPLFVIDLATPTKPKVLGELKIPGFSNYLHPLDETHLIGFGYETKTIPQAGSEEPLVMIEGMKVTLFDVTNLANPKEVDTEVIGGQGTYSPIQYDHHALFQHPEKNLYGFPISIYEQGKGQAYGQFKQEGGLIYEITPEKGIVLKGDLLKPQNPNIPYEDWETTIQRMLFVEDNLYTIAIKEIASYNLTTFEKVSAQKY